MKRLVWAIVAASALLFGIGCNKDSDERPSGGAPASTLGTDPLFNGVSAGRLTEHGVLLEWFDGADAETDTEDLLYVAYMGRGDQPIDLDEPVAVSLPGASSMVVQDLDLDSYRFVVRVRDADGNEDDNRAAVRVSLLDEVAPEFDGVVGAVALSPSELLVQWKPASDDQTPAHRMIYRVYAAKNSEDVFENLVGDSERGATSLAIEMDRNWKTYWVGVRAVDVSGNMDENVRVAESDKPESKAPQFAGLIGGEARDDSVVLRWSPAVDNATASTNILYEVYYSETSGAQDLSRPNTWSEAGATQVTVSDLLPGTTYFFIVRALDEAGNRDENIVELELSTLPADDVAPSAPALTSVESFTPTSITLNWNGATDSRTPSSRMIYEVYLSEESPVDVLEDPVLVSPPGRRQGVILRLNPDTDYFVAVRAIDEAGNASALGVEESVTTREESTDEVPPSLFGNVSAKLVPSDSGLLLVTWSEMSDNSASSGEIRALVCVGLQESDCQGNAFFRNFNVAGEFGAEAVFVSGLKSRTDYYVAVRLQDVNGNIESVSTGATGFTATSFIQDVEPILEVRCNQCHEYTYGKLVTVEYEDELDGDVLIVNPVSVVESYFIRKLREADTQDAPFSMDDPVTYGGARMPSDGSDYLTEETEQIFIDWIDQGAFWN